MSLSTAFKVEKAFLLFYSRSPATEFLLPLSFAHSNRMAASRSNDEVDKDHRNIINSTLKHQFFTWHYIHGYSIDQISELLNRLLEQVHTRISKPVT